MSNEILIDAENVSKIFCRKLKRSLWYGVQDVVGDMFGRKGERAELRPDEFLAVDDVSFELRRGECLGLIGRNGAGKTTLLRMLNGLIKPDKGRIEIRGRVGALIALGAGFNPILTGRENIYVNASVLGLSKKETDGKLEEIIDFAEIDEFIDSPVQTYSSGMQVRLGFAIATALEPDVLLLDEVLAVGDLPFRIKCYRKIDKLRQNAAVILVSHSVEHIGRICSKSLVLEKGKPSHYGDVPEGLLIYNNCSHVENREIVQENFYPVKEITINTDKVNYEYGAEVFLSIDLEIEEDLSVAFRFILFSYPSRAVAGEINSSVLGLPMISLKKGKQKLRMKIPSLNLRAGEYALGYNLLTDKNLMVSVGEGGKKFRIDGSGLGETYNQIPVELYP